ncbi:hypothetical protein [Chamaesiphon sp. OTE_20_metabat_361]|uniref:hypothetical protein n=1 Tax=Chamaesiphon sp. OTE_20_metabat_361 TaxID=2964689 RepID=UPI00286CFB93|nr:hypothetical protein [Chamaesiphon sp. OTE_20_metabat_361]
MLVSLDGSGEMGDGETGGMNIGAIDKGGWVAYKLPFLLYFGSIGVDRVNLSFGVAESGYDTNRNPLPSPRPRLRLWLPSVLSCCLVR